MGSVQEDCASGEGLRQQDGSVIICECHAADRSEEGFCVRGYQSAVSRQMSSFFDKGKVPFYETGSG